MDNGPGIPTSIHKKLFNEVRTTKKKAAHNGIGLVVSRFLAGRNGGWIECTHTDNTGTEFVVYLQVCIDRILKKRSGSECVNEPEISTRS
jgi:C4-dicarboxylate-specific signal transduction histidine kinase